MKYFFSQSGFEAVERPNSSVSRSGPVKSLRSNKSSVQSMRSSLLESIPPERIGLSGEYDHYGLAKRVKLALQQEVGNELVDRLQITQRGRVVIIVGAIASPQITAQIEEIALSIEGAAFVEIYHSSSNSELTPIQIDAA
jgi:hypothetical protein